MSQTKRKPLSPPDTKILYGKAAGRCAFPDCRRELVLEATGSDPNRQIGRIAHIVAHSVDGPRGDPDFPNEKLATYGNSILLCPTCHEMVDAQPNAYPVTKLKAIKEAHENWVRASLASAMSEIGFPELEIIAKGISSSPDKPAENFTVIPPREKMARNGLTNQVEQLILVGMAQQHQVSDFLQGYSMVDSDFSERLKFGFLNAYEKFRAQGLTDDALFETMHEFANGESREFKRQAAGLAILIYLFEACEVFEK
uniref:HNH endonuclease n=1 Tax=Candidatus Kentrum sp. DK TaxID=2126562 RepID=A0A450SFS7_9GAMM|nr:MAG: hypothetical protein BECKDK2373B_GA0170837_103425 [Candidatus Kentron sp. DK]VFJ63400.1 MAG: hypothetical protein BECKDK2373C_GA0170839_11077 [Candidatus Kentron sp. DK]